MRYFTFFILVALLAGLYSCEKTEENKEPVAEFTITPGTGPFTTIFSFDANASTDPDGSDSELKLRWDWDGDGIFDTEYSSLKVMNHQYEIADNYTVVLEVATEEGWTDTELKMLVVYADSVPPTASFTIEPDSSNVTTIFLFDASSSSDPYTPVDELEFRWDWEADGNWDTPYMTDTTTYHKYDLPGTYKVIMEVKNNFTLTDTCSRKVYVLDI